MDDGLAEVVATIEPLDEQAMQAARDRQAQLTKPPGSLGRLETLSVRLAGILGSERLRVRGKHVIVAAADHGVVAEGVTDYPQVVTSQMVQNFLNGGAAVNVFARQVGVTLTIIDAGVAVPPSAHPSLRSVVIGRGTANIADGPAMTRDQAIQAVMAGVALAREAADWDADLIGVGEMGIGNSTVAAAIVAAIAGVSAAVTTGRGTGRNEEQWLRKISVVQGAVDTNRPDPDDGLDVLAKVGGFEIGVLAGVMLGVASARRVVVLDGFITTAAALIAHRLCPLVREYMVAAHLSAERGHRIALAHLELEPLLDLELRLGEGTGAVLAMPIIEAAAASLREMATFASAGVSDSPDRT